MTRVCAVVITSILTIVMVLQSTHVHAQFALAVSPPRLELAGKPGERLRSVIELTHADTQPGQYTVKTADWKLKPDGSVDFSEELLPGSCRPWVTIERRELNLPDSRPYRYRLEVNAPPDTPPTECRFALLIEGKQQTPASNLPMAMAARIGVIAYVTIGDVQPVLEIVGSAVKTVEGKALPALRIRNTGQAHGRLAGFLNATDASGTRLEFQPSTTPIMPGETREVPLTSTKPGDPDTPVAVSYPVVVTGTLEWGARGSIKINERFAQ